MNDGPGYVQLIRGLGFLTRLPLGDHHFAGTADGQTADDAALFPLVGTVIAVPGALIVLVVGWLGGPALLTAAVAVLLTIAITGALHEDGLADTADGFGGGKTAERRLEIMKDSAVGSYGALALTGSVVIRTLAVGALITGAGALPAALAFVAVHTGARAAMVWFWTQLPPVRTDGLSALFGQPLDRAMKTALLTGVVGFVLLGLLSAGLLATLVTGALAIGAVAAFKRLCERMIGGQTGDTIGASEQIVEMVLLIGLAMAA